MSGFERKFYRRAATTAARRHKQGSKLALREAVRAVKAAAALAKGPIPAKRPEG